VLYCYLSGLATAPFSIAVCPYNGVTLGSGLTRNVT
jgi:hypothetical protein